MTDFFSCLSIASTRALGRASKTTRQRVLLVCLMSALAAVQGCGDGDIQPGAHAGPVNDAGGPADDASLPGEDAGPAPEDAGPEFDAGDGAGPDAGPVADGGVDMDGGDVDAGEDTGEPDAAVALVNGLRGDYYRGSSFISYATSRIDSIIDFEYAPDVPPVTLPEDQPEFPHTFYSVRWLGYIEPAVTATYKFWVSADDGQRLWIDGVKILEGWTQGAANAEESSTVELRAGVRYPIRVDMFQHYNVAIARLEWESTDGVVARQIVPTERLFALPLDQPPAPFVTFEAESPSNSATGGSAQDPINHPVPVESSCDNCSGFTRSPLKLAPNNGSITFNVNAADAGDYVLQVWYVNKGTNGADRYIHPSKGTMSINGAAEQEVLYPNNYNDTSVFDSVDFVVPLVLGENTITLAGLSEGVGDTNLDRITLRPVD